VVRLSAEVHLSLLKGPRTVLGPCIVVVLTCFVIRDVCMCGFFNVWVCVCVGFVMCGCFSNMCTCIYCVFVLFL
jgi:hypothetical protein